MNDRQIIDQFNAALNDLWGMVPKQDRETAMDYLRVMQHCSVVLSEALGTLNAIGTKLHHMDEARVRHQTDIKAIVEG